MNFAMKKEGAVLALIVASAGAQAAVVGPTDMRVTGGAWGLGALTGFQTTPIALFDSTLDITDRYSLPGWNTSAAQPLGILAHGAVLSYAYGTGAMDQVNAFFAPGASGLFGGGACPGFQWLLDRRQCFQH